MAHVDVVIFFFLQSHVTHVDVVMFFFLQSHVTHTHFGFITHFYFFFEFSYICLLFLFVETSLSNYSLTNDERENVFGVTSFSRRRFFFVTLDKGCNRYGSATGGCAM